MPKKIIINQLGGPEVLKYVDYNLPENIPEKNVRIRQTAIGLNYIDTYFRSGVYPTPAQLPVCLGIEAAGEIVGLGKGVNDFILGDRVCYASPPLGAYCEIRDYPVKNLIKTPNKISDDQVASILLQGMTVEYLFNRLHKIKKNQYVLFHAAAGGVGLVACQWARAVGCNLIGTVGSDEKAELAKQSGCKFVINYKKESVVDRVNDITGGLGVPVVYDGVGVDTFESSLSCLSLRGLFVSFGQSSGMVPDVNLHKTFNPKSLFYTRPTLMHYNSTREELNNSSYSLFSMINQNKIKTNIFKVYDLKDVASAHSDLQSKKTSGSIIFKV